MIGGGRHAEGPEASEGRGPSLAEVTLKRRKAAAVTKFSQKRAPPWENGCISMVPRIEIP